MKTLFEWDTRQIESFLVQKRKGKPVTAQVHLGWTLSSEMSLTSNLKGHFACVSLVLPVNLLSYSCWVTVTILLFRSTEFDSFSLLVKLLSSPFLSIILRSIHLINALIKRQLYIFESSFLKSGPIIQSN